MVLGINASLTNITNGITADGPTVDANFDALNAGGISNDGLITTDAAGGIVAVSLRATNSGGLVYMLSSPHLLANNVTLNGGNTNNYTCTGVGGVPSAAKAVILNVIFTPSAAATWITITPHSTAWTGGKYPLVGTSATGSTLVSAQLLTIFDGSGVIDVAAGGGGNATSLYIGICGYTY